MRRTFSGDELLPGRVDIAASHGRDYVAWAMDSGHTAASAYEALGFRADCFEPPNWDDVAGTAADCWIALSLDPRAHRAVVTLDDQAKNAGHLQGEEKAGVPSAQSRTRANPGG